MDKLEIIYPDGNIEFHDLDPNRRATNIGSHPENDVEIASLEVAPFHAVLNHQHPYHLIVISRVGQTFLNGQPVQANVPVRLGNRAIVEMEGHRLILLEDADRPAEPAGVPVGGPATTPEPETETPPTGQQAQPQPSSGSQPLDSRMNIITPPTTQPVPTTTPIDPSSYWGAGRPQTDRPDKDRWIDIALPERDWTLDAGQTAFIELTITNGGNAVAGFDAQVTDLPPEWLDAPVKRVELDPADTTTITFSLTPPRLPSSRAGTGYFAIVVTSPEYERDEQNQRIYSRLGATLTINPYHEFEVTELMPRVQTTTWQEPAGFTEFEIINQGNADTHFHIQSGDTKQQCSFEIAIPGKNTMLAGQADLLIPIQQPRQAVGVQIIPMNRRFFSFRKINYPFTVATNPIEGQTSHHALPGELDNKPLFGPIAIALMSLVLLLLIVLIFRPRIIIFTVDQHMVKAGTPVTLSWNVSRLANPRIDQNVGALDEPVGNATAVPVIPSAAQPEVTYKLKATNWLSSLFSIFEAEREVKVAVEPVKPEILVFSADRELALAGEEVMLNWEVENANEVVLQTNGNPETLRSEDHSDRRDIPLNQNTDLVLVASNQFGEVSRNLSIGVQTPTPTPTPTLVPPNVIAFNVRPPEITQGDSVTIDWAVIDAGQVSIAPIPGNLPPNGNLNQSPDTTTQYILSASNGNPAQDIQIVQQVIVNTPTPTPTPTQPPPPGIQQFDVNPSEIVAGESVQITWQVDEVQTVSIQPGFEGLPPTGSLSDSPDQDTTYVLTAQNEQTGETASSIREVKVTDAPAQPKIKEFKYTHNGDLVKGKNNKVLLEWELEGDPETIELSSPVIGTIRKKKGDRTHEVTISDDATFLLTVSTGDLKDSLQRVVALDPPDPIILRFEAEAGPNTLASDIRPLGPERYSVVADSTVKFSWEVQDAFEVTLKERSNDFGNQPFPTGSLDVIVKTPGNYELNAKNAAGKSAEPKFIKIEIEPPSSPTSPI